MLAVDVCIAVTDGGGHLLAMARMDRAPLLCVQIAQDKAYSVASFGGLPTSDWWRLLESEPALLHGIVKTERLDRLRRRGAAWWPTGGRWARSGSPAGPASRTSRSPRRGPPSSAEGTPMARRIPPGTGAPFRRLRRYCGGRANRIEQFGRPLMTCSATLDAR